MLLAGITALAFLSGCGKEPQIPDGTALVLSDPDSGRIYAAYALDENEPDAFTVSFRHSVNQSMVYDIYSVTGETIYLEKTKYYAFGAGVPTEVEEGITLTYEEDGAMVLSGYHREMPRLIYSVSRVYDHILTVGGEDVSLGDLCGHGAHILFTVRADGRQ